MTALDQAALGNVLAGIVGADNVLTRAATLALYARDRSPFRELRPAIAVRPGTTEEIAAVLRLANERRIPVVPRGAGFSLAGFAPIDDGAAIFLDTRRMNRVLEVDETDMTVTAEAGIIAADLDRAVSQRGLAVNTVAVPLHHTTIGGILSGVVAGGLPRDLGNNVERLLGLTVVLPTGTIVRTNAGGSNRYRTASTMLDGDGPFLTPMFVGDGGALGVKTEVTMQLEPIAEHVRADAWLVPDHDAAWAVIADLGRIRETPYTMLGVHGEPGGQVVSFVARASTPALLDLHVAALERTIRRHGGRPASDEARTFAASMTEAGGAWTDQYIEVERSLLAYIFANRDFRAAHAHVERFLDERFAADGLAGLGLRRFTHYAPVNRHAIYVTTSLVYDESSEAGRRATAALSRDAYALVARLGGYAEPHQGTCGPILADAWSPEYRALLHMLKRALDPHGILNPGLWADAAG